MRIGIIDGQGGGVGCALIERLKGKGHDLLALGANAMATSAMLRCGASEGATGENAVIHCAPLCDVLCGPIGIVLPNALLGEITPAMAQAIASSPAAKVLIPSSRCCITIAGVQEKSLGQYADDAARKILER